MTIMVPGTLPIGLARNSSRVFAFHVTPCFFRASVYIGKSFTVAALRPTMPASVGPVTGPPGSVVVEWQTTQSRSNTALPWAALAAKAGGVVSADASISTRKERLTDMDDSLLRSDSGGDRWRC